MADKEAGLAGIDTSSLAGPDPVSLLPALVRLRRMPRGVAEARARQVYGDDLCMQEVQEGVPQGCRVSEKGKYLTS